MTAMTSRASDSVPPGMYVPTADARVVMRGVGWHGYQSLHVLRGEERSRPKLAYLDGAVELMSPSRDHERINYKIGQIVTFYCVELGIPIAGYGKWTLKNEAKEAGAEPDECFIFDADPEAKDRPDLVIEVIWTSGGIDKLEIYRRLGISEAWFWDDDTIVVYVLGSNGYERRERSTWLPDLELGLVCQLAKLATANEQVQALRASLGR